MLSARNTEHQCVVRGTEVTSDNPYLQPVLECVICGEPVKYNPKAEDPFESFSHLDGRPSCYESAAMTAEHSRATEVAVSVIYNRLTHLTSEPIEIDNERRIGSPPGDFVITDVRVTRPFKAAAEIFYRSDNLGLRRRLSALTKRGYKTWLIFHKEGIHSISRIERYLQELASVRPGRYDPNTQKVTLGGLFTRDKIDDDKFSDVPRYMR